MAINIGLPHLEGLKPRIAVIGVGGAGGNAIANMIAAEVQGVDFLVANTDAQALSASEAANRIQLGAQITQGLGAGAQPEVGRAAAEEAIAEIEQALEGMHMVFLAAGMGGGTGTGAAPVIAKIARDRGILTVGVVTKPFSFEGNRRMRSADAGIEELERHVDTLIVIPNQNLFMIAEAKTTFIEAFRMADEVLQQGVRGITDLMVMPGLVNLDFADVKSVMRDAGKAMMGTGEAEGDGRALAAAQQAIANPLLDGVSMAGAKGVIISISGGEDLGLFELQEAGDHIRDLVDPDANIIWGSAFNPQLNGKIRVSVVATGLETPDEANVERPALFGQRAAAPQRSAPGAGVGLAPSPVLGTGAPSLGAGAPSLGAGAPSLGASMSGGAAASPARAEPAPADTAWADDDGSEASPTLTPPTRATAEPQRSAVADADRTPVLRPAREQTEASAPAPGWSLPVGEPQADAMGRSSAPPPAASASNAAVPPPTPPTPTPTPPPAPVARYSDFGDEGDDELLLDDSAHAPTAADMGLTRAAPKSPAPAPAPTAKSAAAEPAKPAGATLFERMKHLSRLESNKSGSGSDDDDDPDGFPAMPKFLGRQSNQ